MSNKSSHTFEQIKKDILAKKYSPIYFLQGEENYFIDEVCDLLEDKVLTPEEKSFNFTVYYGKDISPMEIKMACRRFPMMSEFQLIIVKEAQNIKDWDPLIDYFKNPFNQTILCFAHKNKKIDGRSSLSKLLSQHVLLNAEPIRDYEVPQWITSFIAAKGKSIDPKATELICNFVGNDLIKLKSEINKMFINLPKELPIVNIHHVEQNIGISKEFNFFELQKAIGAKNFNKSIQIANYFAENESKLEAIFMGFGVLNSYFGKLYQLYDYKNKTKDEACKALNITPFFYNDYLNSIQLYSKEDIEIVLGYIKYYDLCAKGVNNVGRSKGDLLIELTVKILKVNEIKKIKNLN